MSFSVASGEADEEESYQGVRSSLSESNDSNLTRGTSRNTNAVVSYHTHIWVIAEEEQPKEEGRKDYQFSRAL